MESNYAPRRLMRLVGRFAVCAWLACAVSAFADTLDERNELIHHFVTDYNANPLAADCAAHGNFIASTSAAFDHVDFPPSSFDPSHSTIEPWNDSFDEKKQRIKVDNVVTVEGQGMSKSGEHDSTPLKFRCGYVGSQMLAFGWNDPVPPLRARTEAPARSTARGGKHGATAKHGAKSKPAASAGKAKTTSKASTKSTKASSGSTKKTSKKH
ncbi:BspC domain-containing protein [Caballeronia sp. RCC_10]|uniref:BspC domain-containing protein n=1 Tax=Caballeronia sp. RCC_10 TaxID=3239227 RepID=UPI0035256AC4